MQFKIPAGAAARTALFAAIAFASVPAAFAADCSAKQAETAGKAAADLARAKVETVMPVAGKEMMNLSSCREKGSDFEIKFKYNFMGADGYNWVEAEGVVLAAGGGTIEIKRISDKLKELAAAKNVVLASR